LNKSDFDKDSPAWQAAQRVAFREMEPFITKLLQRKDPSEPSEEERLRAMEAKDLAHKALDKIAEMARRGLSGQQRGRKSPAHREAGAKRQPSATTERKEAEARTPPPPDAVGDLRRKGMSLDWDVRALDPRVRSATSTD